MNTKTKLLILTGNLAPVVVALITVPGAIRDLSPAVTPESAFAHVMLAALPALLVAAVGALMALWGGVSILIDWKKSQTALPFTHKLWLVGAAILPLAFAMLFLVGFVKQNF